MFIKVGNKLNIDSYGEYSIIIKYMYPNSSGYMVGYGQNMGSGAGEPSSGNPYF